MDKDIFYNLECINYDNKMRKKKQLKVTFCNELNNYIKPVQLKLINRCLSSVNEFKYYDFVKYCVF